MTLKIRHKILILIAVVYVPFLVFSLLFFYRNHANLRDAVSTRYSHEAAKIAIDIRAVVERSFAILDTLAEHPAVRNGNPAEMDLLFARICAKFPLHMNVLYADEYGDNKGSGFDGANARKLNYRDMQWFVSSREGKKFAGNLHISKLFKKPVVMIAIPAGRGSVYPGVLGMPLDLAAIAQVLRQHTRENGLVNISVVDGTGVVLASTLAEAGDEYPHAPASRDGFWGNTARIEARDRNGVSRFYFLEAVDGTGWTVVVDTPVSTAFGDARKFARDNMILISLLSLIVAAIAIFIMTRISADVAEIVRGIERVASGERNVAVRVTGRDELSRIGAAVNEMVTAITVTEDRIRESEVFMRDVLDRVGLAVSVYDKDLFMMMENREHRDLCRRFPRKADRPALHEGICVADGSHAEGCMLEKTLMTGRPRDAQVVLVSGEERGIFNVETYPLTDAAGGVTCIVQTIKDVSEKKGLEEKLLQAQKMEAVGLLAGGVAHDFNNILTSIMGYGELIGLERGLSPKVEEYASQIVSSSEKAAALTRGLLAFSRRQKLQAKPVMLNAIIENIAKMLKRIIGERTELTLRFGADELPVLADTAQIEQVIVNLVTNAQDAMETGGTLGIETGRVVFEEERQTGFGSIVPGTYMYVTVCDSGAGIDDSVRAKMFEPFFTTKDSGRGTGLGLSIVHGIVKQHGGFVYVESGAGHGTSITVYLPVCELLPEKDAPEAARSAGTAGREVPVLVADDDAGVLGYVKEVLTRNGYRVFPAANGSEALALFRNHRDEIEILLLDVIMPGMNGRDVAAHAIREKKDVAVIFMSGYPGDLALRSLGTNSPVTLLLKPLDSKALLRAFSDAAERRRSAKPVEKTLI